MDFEHVNCSIMDLERRTYRYLQQLAKSLCLPSNVKKVHLIHLIHAKKFKSDEEVNNIIQQVKAERQQLMQTKKSRKRKLQNREISSTSRFQSPPITHTPKRPVHPVVRYSPEFPYSLHKNMPRNYAPCPNISARAISSSDRVLRSFNLKAIRKSCGAGNQNNTQSSAIKDHNPATSPKDKIVRVVSATGKLTKYNLAGKYMDRRHRPSILGGSSCVGVRNDNPRQYIVPHNPKVVLNQEIAVPHPKRQRTLSGIYPLIPQEMPHQNFDHIQGVRLRHIDGRLTTINALVCKRNEFIPPPKQNNEVSIQDILNTIDSNLSNPLNNNYLQSAGSSGSVAKINPMVSENYKQNDYADGYSVYYHKKIRSEQVRYQRLNYQEPPEENLPRITDAFSRFNSGAARNVREPLYYQFGEESERTPTYTQPGNLANSHMLESLYNFKSSLLTNAPLAQIAATANTKSVYSTPVIATAMAQQPLPLVAAEPFDMAPCEPDNQYRCSHDIEMPHLYDLLKQTELDGSYRRIEQGDRSNATSPGISEQATIPEMVEDALEIISQDGDYMERISMDIRVQCVLCSWAGPKIILEYHIRKEHPSDIHGQRSEYRIPIPLGALAGRWAGRVLEHDAALCVLAAGRRRAALAATLCSLSSDPVDRFVSITTYNKVTGEPFTWEGPIQPLPPNLPYENDSAGLTVELSKLDLLPNSANIELIDNELVLKSPTKVVVGQPELNDIHIVLFVRIS